MRLTLRTMLAYLDDILEPEDAEDINKKISESDFASSLVHRTRDCIRRVRLGTPALEGKGLAADANTVAEYLDNTLAGERVPEFEKVCLESDVHLAEVASCHQVLTLVLGEPADVKGLSRERMYNTINQAETSATVVKMPEPQKRAAHRTPTPVDTPDVISIPKRHKPEVPDYLRESSGSRRWRFVTIAAVTAAVVLGILFVFGPADLREQVASWMGSEPTPATPDQMVVEPADKGKEPSVTQDDSNERESAAPVEEEPPVDESQPPTEERPAPDSVTPATSTEAPREIVQPSTIDPVPTDVAPDASGLVPPAPEEQTTNRIPTDSARPTDLSPPPVPAVTSAEPPPPLDLGPTDSGSTPAPENPLRSTPIDIDQGIRAEVGRYLTDAQVAVLFDPDTKEWRRLAPRAVINSGDRILTLPPFRPAFGLTGGTTIQVAGPSLIDFDGLDEDAIPVVDIEYGRMLILSVGKAGNKLHLRFGDRNVIVTFDDAQSTLALEATGVLPPGTDPEVGPSEIAVDLYVTSGHIIVNEGDKQTEIKAPEHLSLTERSVNNLAPGQLPEWAIRDVVKPLEAAAGTIIERELAGDRPLNLAIKELSTTSKRVEVRAMAIRCGGYLGDFDAYTSGLNDDEQNKQFWTAQVESLKAALARGPETAALVRESFERLRAADAKLLYRMLWGYTPDQLKAGEDAKLVGGLSSDSLDVRRLSFWNLQNITNKTFGYQPEYQPARLKVPISKWRGELGNGKILPTPPPAGGRPVGELKRNGDLNAFFGPSNQLR
jgi:hypothetical protein